MSALRTFVLPMLVSACLFCTGSRAAEPAMLVKDVNPNANGIDPRYMLPANVNGTLFFVASFSHDNWELWKSDGTEAGTVLVRSLVAIDDGFVHELVNVNGTLFFNVMDVANGNALWKSDGTAAGTLPIAPLVSATCLANVNGTLFFVGDDGINGAELWKSDGTPPGTAMVKDINPGTMGSYPMSLADVNGTLFFSAFDGVNGDELWKSDGTATGTVMVKDINPGTADSIPMSFINVGGTLFFAADDGVNGVELWKSDGTAAGTAMVMDIAPGAADSYPYFMTSVGGTLYLAATDGVHGAELWKTDGTTAGTAMVKDINPGAGDSYIYDLTAVGSTLFFSADDGASGQQLWKSDGTDAGTVRVSNIPGGVYSEEAFPVIGNTVFFAASLKPLGVELWKSDGTPAGTALVQDINQNGGSFPTNMIISGANLFFSASDGWHQRELWAMPVANATLPCFTCNFADAATVGAPYTFTLTASDSPTSYNATGLPSGLTFSGNTISGTPSRFGTFTIALSATNATGTRTDKLTLTVKPAAALSGSSIDTIAGNGLKKPVVENVDALTAAIRTPVSLAVDNTSQCLYIADSYNNIVWKVDSARMLTRFAGTGAINTDSFLKIPLGLFSGDGAAANLANLSIPLGVVCDASGNVYIADTGNHRVRKVDAATGIITTVAGIGALGTAWPGVPLGGFSGDNGPAVNAALNFPSGLAVDGAGNLYIADTGNHRVRKVDAASGTITTVAGKGNSASVLMGYSLGAFAGDGGAATDASLSGPTGLTFDSAGNLFIADTINHRIRKVDAATKVISTVAGGGTTSAGPLGILFGGYSDGCPATGAALDCPTSVAVDSAGRIYIADVRNNCIRVVSGGVIHTLAGHGAASGYGGDTATPTLSLLQTPTGVALDDNGNLYIADMNNHRVRRITPPSASKPALSIAADINPAPRDVDVTFTGQADNPNNGQLDFAWAMGDGNIDGPGDTVTHTYSTEGAYTVTATVGDGTGVWSDPAQLSMNVEAPNSGGDGVSNISQDQPPVTNPLNGISISVVHSEGGVVELYVDVNALVRSAFDVSTDFNGVSGLLGNRSGVRPTQKFTGAGVYVASSSAYTTGTRNLKGRARKLLLISGSEVGEAANHAAAPSSAGLVFSQLRGKFRLGGGSSASTSAADSVSVSTQFELPEGMDLSQNQDLYIGVGNIIDHVVVNAKGKPVAAADLGRLKKVQLRYPRVDKTTHLTVGDAKHRTAKLTLTLAANDMVQNGFDTEGVAPESNGKKLSIQTGIVIGGVAYESAAPVQLKVSSKQDSGTISFSRK